MPASQKTKKKIAISKEDVVEWYMNDVLDGKGPMNVHLFAKNHGITEDEFYQLFGSLVAIENHFFELIFDKTKETIQRSKPYQDYSAREKLLGFYFTFFGNLTSNRSFVLHLLKPYRLENLRKLKGLHKKFTAYVNELDFEKVDLKYHKLNKAKDMAINEAAWLQLLSVMRFWYKDESPGFEKTDIFIEKLLTASFDLMNTRPMKSVTDLGKFIFKEMNPVS
ncbi:MAG: hypothetical protein J0H55_07185 [Chitinophagaceae bacterium]|nr:hypothetical protein [Chitinophagaceae bacterium]